MGEKRVETRYEPGVQVSLILMVEDKKPIVPDSSFDWEGDTEILIPDINEEEVLAGIDILLAKRSVDPEEELFWDQWRTHLSQVEG